MDQARAGRHHRARAGPGPLRRRHDPGRRRGRHGRVHPRRHLQRLRLDLHARATSPPWWPPRPRASSSPGRRSSTSTATRDRHRLPDALLRRPDHPRHAHRLVQRHLPPDRAGWRLQTRAMTFLRRSGARDSGKAARPDSPARPRTNRPTKPARAMELAEFKVAVDPGSTSTRPSSPPSSRASGRSTSRWPSCARSCAWPTTPASCAWGWPERVGGLGGSNLLRAYLGEALTARDLVEPGIYSMPEVLAPTMIDFAPDELAAEMVPRLLSRRGDLVPGLLRAGHGEQPGLARVPGHADR